MSSIVEFASQVINDDRSRVSPLVSLVLLVSDAEGDPVKAAYRSQLLEYLFTQTPEFDAAFESYMKRLREREETRSESLSGATH